MARFPLSLPSWSTISVRDRWRLGLVTLVLAVLLVVAFVAVPALPCGAPGGDVCPPADDAIALVPDDALAYLHVNVDPGTEQYDNASAIAGARPTMRGTSSRGSGARRPWR